jgi:hypothetical protein
MVLYRPDPDGDEVIGSATITGTTTGFHRETPD